MSPVLARDTAPGPRLADGHRHDPVDRARLTTDVALATRLVPPVRPLGAFVAVNPLGGLEHLPFAEAAARAADLFGAPATLPEESFREAHATGRITDADLRDAAARVEPDPGRAASLVREMLHAPPLPAPDRPSWSPPLVDEHVARWCAAYADAGGGQAGWSLPGAERGLYAAWRGLVAHDWSLPRAARAALADLPDDPTDAVLDAFEALGVAPSQRRRRVEAELTILPGWAGHLRWRAEAVGDVEMVEYLALRLSLTAALVAAGAVAPPVVPPPPVTVPGSIDRRLVWQEAYEASFRRRLLAEIGRGAGPSRQPGARPASQVVCCIDVREEGLRRHLEAVGDHETLGFAGFFAVALRWTDLAGGEPVASCPVLVSPRFDASEAPARPDAAGAADRRRRGLASLEGVGEAFHDAKEAGAAPFVLAEASGWVTGPAAALRTLAPLAAGALDDRLHGAIAPGVATRAVLDGIPADERLATARVALRMMGLVDGFARLVVLCAHSSHTEANPYEAALRCGACGGHGGGPNARVLAAILNDPAVRRGLAADGIVVPDDTVVLAAEHDTTTDEVRLLEPHLVPPSHRDEVARLEADLAAAGAALAAERCATLPGAPAPEEASSAGRRLRRRAARHVRRRSRDWAEVVPEWGLAGNAAFVIGPRSLTQGRDLGRRVFLHSYDPAADPGFTGLETILTAPLVVAQWISCQYLFSTVAPDVFGSGTKALHNVVGGVGVLGSHTGDLRSGLPAQSVGLPGGFGHEPMRLLVVVQAPRAEVAAIVERNAGLADLVHHEWITLVARDDHRGPWWRLTADGWTAVGADPEG